MKCENCGSELVGAAIVCRQCNHNNAQGRVSQWRARRTGELQKPATRTLSPLASADQSVRTEIIRPSNSRPLEPRRPASIPFEPKIQINHASASSSPPPASSSPVPATEDDAGSGQYPPWRAQLKERVKQSRERRVTGPIAVQPEPDETELDPNPIVEAALKRIRWSAPAPSSTPAPRIVRHGAQAAALAEEPEFDVEPQAQDESKSSPSKTDPSAESKNVPKPAVRTTPTNPLLARKPGTQPINQAETKPMPTRLPPAPKPQITTSAESRIEIKPAAKPEAKPATESKAADPKPRITGNLKTSPQPAAKQQPEKSAPETTTTTHRKPVETKVIGLPQSTGTKPSAKQKPAAKERSSTIWVRTLAGACDFEIVASAYLPLFASYATLNASFGRESFIIMFLLLATLTFCYQLLTLTMADRTSGMALLNLRLVNVADGGKRPIVFTQKFARAVAATAAFLCPPLNLIVMQSNRRRHTLPDLLSGTTLVEK